MVKSAVSGIDPFRKLPPLKTTGVDLAKPDSDVSIDNRRKLTFMELNPHIEMTATLWTKLYQRPGEELRRQVEAAIKDNCAVSVREQKP